MRLTRSVLFSLAALGTAVPATAQLRAVRPQRPVQNLPRLFVATPFVSSSADSTAAVRVGDGLRKRMANVAGKWFRVITREQMNEALMQYAYPADAVLAPVVARTLAGTLQAQALVTGIMARSENNRFSASVRVVGYSDKAGFLANLAQTENQSLEDFGSRLADQLTDAFKAMEDARECRDNQFDKVDRAIKAARDALKKQPNHGLAEFCLGEIFLAQKATDSALVHFTGATRGDSLSLEAWNEVLKMHVARNDTNTTILTLKQMLRVAPNNQALRDEACKAFQAYGRPEEAMNLTNEAIALDPTNPDWYDLKSNACLSQSNFVCAIDALEQMYELDREKADTTFFLKISIAADQQPDTTRLLKWARLGAQKYPNHPQVVDYLVKAYSYAGPLDSLVATTRRYIALDSSDVRPVLLAVQGLVRETRYDDAYSLGDLVERFGDDDAKQNYGIILLGALQPLVSNTPPNPTAAAPMARKILTLTTNPQVVQQTNLYLGFATWQLVTAQDPAIMEQKSCDLVRSSQALMAEGIPAMEIGLPVFAGAAGTLTQMREYQSGRLSQMAKAYCR